MWDEAPRKTKPLLGSLTFTGVLCVVWLGHRAHMVVPWRVAGLPRTLAHVSRRLQRCGSGFPFCLPPPEHPWQALLPGAILVAIGFQVLHQLVHEFLVPKLEKSTSLYGGLGAATTIIFFIYLMAMLVVTAPVLNSSLYDELQRERAEAPEEGSTPAPIID